MSIHFWLSVGRGPALVCNACGLSAADDGAVNDIEWREVPCFRRKEPEDDLSAARRERDAWREVAERLAEGSRNVIAAINDVTCTCGGTDIGVGVMHEPTCGLPNPREMLDDLEPGVAAYDALRKEKGR